MYVMTKPHVRHIYINIYIYIYIYAKVSNNGFTNRREHRKNRVATSNYKGFNSFIHKIY